MTKIQMFNLKENDDKTLGEPSKKEKKIKLGFCLNMGRPFMNFIKKEVLIRGGVPN